ncbi:MAG: right-handed parallel beta-helix repeat-containing protein [Flavobacteriales bacterium]|nr:right-handed parallel beta-helix repeat-containing protein [Flavobacteriales bacterium]
MRLKFLRSLQFFIFSLLLAGGLQVKAQTSTLVFDYDFSSCTACGDSVITTSNIRDSFVDATASNKFVSFLQVRAYLFTCTTDSVELYLNGVKMQSSYTVSKCFCGGCDSLAWNILGNNLQGVYNYGGKNIIEIRLKSTSTMWFDRFKVIRTLSDRYNYDAGVTRLDTPMLRSCAGTTPIRVEIANFGRRSFSTVDVEWTWNGSSQTGVTYSSKLDSVSSSGIARALVTLGTKTLSPGKIDTLVAWTDGPGGQVDSAGHNDTLVALITVAFSDTITVGGTSPDFTSLSAAVSALHQYGICGPLVVSIRPGTYTEQLEIGTIPGADSINRVTFTSSTGDSSDVLINYSSSSSSMNYTIRLNYSSNIDFRHVTIEALGSSYSTVVNLNGELDNVGFYSCRFLAATVTTSSTSRALIYRSYAVYNENGQDLTFDRCVFAGGSYGAYLYNAYGNYFNRCQFTNNQFLSQYYTGLYIYYHRNTLVENNFFSYSGTTGAYGMRLYNSTNGLWVVNNRLIGGSPSYNIHINSHSGTMNQRGLVANNLLSTTAASNTSYYANVNLEYNSYLDFVHNNIQRSEDGTEPALQVYYGSNIRTYNNILKCSGNSPALTVYNGGSPNIAYSDHNCYRTMGVLLGSWDGSALSTLNDLQTASGMDSNSVDTDPNYVSLTDLKPYNVDLDAAGKGDPRVPLDFDGLPRDTTNPDIGAIEFDLVKNDAGIVEIKRFVAGSGCYEVVMRNFGKDTLKSVSIGWSLNGSSKTPVSWTGTLAKGDTTHLCLDTTTFSTTQAYNLKVWTSSPNSSTDSFPLNDTSSARYFAALSGDYTLGGGSSDFVNFDSALAALERGGVIDSARFLVQSGTYTSQLVFGSIYGADHEGAVIFQGAAADSTAAVLQFGSTSSSTNYVVKLDMARGITFRHMTLHNTSAGSYKQVVQTNNSVLDITFDHCVLTNNDTTSTSSSVELVEGYAPNMRNLKFIGNVFRNGSTGLYLEGGYNSYASEVVIHGNTFVNQNRRGLILYYQDGISVRNNTILGMRNSMTYGLEFYDWRGPSSLIGNQVYITGTNLYSGIYGSYYYDASDTMVVANNFVSVQSSQSCNGMQLYDLNPGLVAYNNVWNRSTDSSSSGSAIFFSYGDFYVYNNNMVHTANGYAYYLSSEYRFKSNFNNLFSNKSNPVYYDGVNYSSIAAYQSGENKDTNSVAVNPQYTSTSDLHVSSVLLNKKGKPLNLVNVDIDGEQRDSMNPDIGADEFSPPAKDASVIAFASPGSVLIADTLPYTVVVQNFGLDTINEVSAAGRISTSHSTTNFSVTKSTKTLAPGDTTHIRLGTYVFHQDSSYSLTAWSSSPGGVSDQKPSNDTLSQEDIYPAMAGIYTIGGSSPDFSSIRAAVAALKRAGISDTVTFRIRSGTYNERVDLSRFRGTFGRNSIIFESESGDSSTVTIQHTATQSDSNWVVYFRGTEHVTFRKLTIRSSSTGSYARVIQIDNNCKDISIHNCFIEGRNVSSTSQNYSLIYSGNNADEGIWILNNRLRNGSYGVYLYEYPSSSPYTQTLGIRIENNDINCYRYGIYVYYADSLRITGNKITSDNYSSFYGIYIEDADSSLNVSNNTIVLNRGYMGIYIYYGGLNATSLQPINNNFISMLDPTNSGIYGIYSYNGGSLDISYNSIFIANTNSNYGIANYYGSNCRILNNNIEAGSGRALYYYYGSQSSDYNNLHSSGPYLGYKDGTDYADLSAWESGTMLDSNSISVMPQFKSNTDLHMKDLRLNGKAKPLAEVLTDIDGEMRDSITPDIGADEYIPPKLDAGIIDVITPKMPFLADTQQVVVVLGNFGSDTLKTANITWQLNDSTYPVYSWSGSLALGDTAWVKLGSHVFDLDSGYSFKSWTSNPNSGTDALAENDTAELKDQYPALSGIYTVGGGSPDFNTLGDVLTALSRGGVYDSARFDIRSGTYLEQLEFKRYIGANKKHAIIFQSELKDSSKVFLSASSTSSSKNYSVLLDSASGITFRHLTLTTPGITYSNVVRIYGGSTDICFEKCHITGSNTSSTSADRALVYIYAATRNAKIQNVEFRNSNFNFGAYGIYGTGYHLSGQRSEDIRFTNNNFSDQYYYSLYLYYVDRPVIEMNRFEGRASMSSSGTGIYIYYCDKYRVTSNSIKMIPYMGIRAEYSYGSVGDSTLLANNMVSMNGTGTSYGLYLYGASYAYILNNNVRLVSTSTSSYVLYLNGSPYYAYNNNFTHFGNGYAAYYSSYSSSSRIDHNNYFTNGSNIIYRGSTYTSFANYQSSTGLDGNGLNIDPDYVSATDLHTREANLDRAGKAFPHLVPFDFDGEVRDSVTPDIGADEISIPSANDAGIVASTGPIAPFASGSNAVYAVIRNFGSDSLKSATIHWSVNGGTATTYSWTGGLKTYEFDTVNLGNFSFSSGTHYSIRFWTSSPNGVADTINYNDTFDRYNMIPGLIGTYTVGGSAPDFATIADAVTALKNAGTLGNVIFSIRAGTYNETITLEPYSTTSPTSRVTFQSSTGNASDVIWRPKNYGDGKIVYINGADRLRFRNITFRPQAGYTTYIVEMNNSSSNVEFRNNVFDMNSYTYYGTHYGIRSSSDNDDSLVVSNNTFKNGYMGVYLYGINSSNPEKFTRIDSNTFTSQYSYAIAAYYQNGIRIRSNQISSSVTGVEPIYLYYSSGSCELAYNKISRTYNGSSGVDILYHQGGVSMPFLVHNNFITINAGGGTYTAFYTSNSSYLNLYFNSIHVYNGGSSSTPFAAYNTSSLDIRNNIFANSGNGYSFYMSNSTLSQSNYNNFYTAGTTLAGLGATYYTSLSSFRSATGKDAQSLSVDPYFFSDTDLHTGISSLDSAGTPITGITDDIDRESRNTTKPDIGADEFNSLPRNLGVQNVLVPLDGCDMDTIQVKVTLFNYGSQAQVNFPIRYQLNGGLIDSFIVTDTIKRGASLVAEFDSMEILSTGMQYNLKVWTDLNNEQFRANDTVAMVFNNYQKPDSVKSMVPANGTVNVSFPLSLSWLPSTGATHYDIYLWDSTGSKPGSPNFSNLTQISYQINSGLTYGATYYWQIVAKNSVCATEGVIQKFKMKYLPDLVVTSVVTPSSAFSSTNITINWTVKNQGLGNSGGTWFDRLYLSDDALYGSDIFLGGFVNPSAPNAGGTYSQTATVTLPNGISGSYRVFVLTDVYGNLTEGNENNNIARDSGTAMNVSLTPPPDLIVNSVIAPTNGFSGQPVYITYTVKNDGTGPTRSGLWYDRIYITSDSTLNSSLTLLKTIQHVGNLLVDSTYFNASVPIILPNNIKGKRFIIVHTDQTNQEYEYASEGNNTNYDSMEVILTPPPDLVVRDVVVPTSASNREYITVNFHTMNDGGTSTGKAYYDAFYLSQSPVLNTSTAYNLGSIRQPTTGPGDTATNRSVTLRIPSNINGKYYLFVVTDANGYIEELSGESNNVSKGDSIIINSPDLVVRHVDVDARDTSGHLTRIEYWVKNLGPGADLGTTRSDSFYIHTGNTWSSSARRLSRYTYTTTIQPGDSHFVSTTVRIPDGTEGKRYFFVSTDAQLAIFENGKDNNNRGVSDSMTVDLAPYPDLIPRLDTFPDSTEAGNLIKLQYNVRNDGDTTAMPLWRDAVYLSQDSVWSSNDLLLGPFIQNSQLLKGASYDVTLYPTLPSSLTMGTYYFIVRTDYQDNVYEHGSDNQNNIFVSKGIFIDGYPPIDLVVSCPDVADTMWSGLTYVVNYTVTNNGQASTAVGFWTDYVYLSTDSVYSSNDEKIGGYIRSGNLAKGASYSVSLPVKIPNGRSGNFYLIVRTDTANRNVDVDLSSNSKAACKAGAAHRKVLRLTPPPDLKITSWTVPGTGTSGQNINIKYTVKNDGSGPTTAGAWVDKIYLSTDYTLDNSDYSLGSHTHAGDLTAGGSYSVDKDFLIPLDKTGNFIVIIKTDVANVVYEHTQEGNNTAASISTFSQPPPADLIVSQVLAPSTVLSGGTINVQWKVKNQGTNPAQGYIYDNVYLSKDLIADASDLLLGSEGVSINLGQNSEISRSMNYNISGVPMGNYYVLVTTDVRNTIYESNDTNNTENAFNQLYVTVPLLSIGTEYLDTMSDNEKMYYRFIVPDSLKGESLLITLKGDSANGNNEMYLRYIDLATAANFDQKHRDPFQGNQEIILPEADTGTYYLHITGSVDPGNSQNLRILVEVLPFEIRRITPNSGGNAGEITILVEGSKFDSTTKFYLEVPGRVFIPEDTGEIVTTEGLLTSRGFDLIDPTKAYVTYDLSGWDTGYYDLVALKEKENDILEKGFLIEEGIGEDLQVNIIRPGNTRSGVVISITVQFTNKGNNDLVGRAIELVSTQGAPISLTPGGISQGNSTLQIVVEGTEGPPGRLAAGASGSVVVYVQSSAALGIMVNK